ncbi:ArdC-like ssDNA-binding domain-containing protein [Cellulomonas sp. McL0617]|uniref:ArdC-like ssDNA-binding domain-containing protein n=1 Tax=Cellulomonas sp. McL0617 TaxID=3415675 RepID=UPI003CF02EA3
MPTADRPSSDDRLAAIHAQLVDAVNDLTTSEAWARMLTIAARFTDYSPSNVLLIATQRPDATRVAGIRTWNSLGRRVTKGEHGIAILAPCISRRTDDQPPPRPDQPPEPGTADSTTAADRHVLSGFRVVHVFDLTQTEGDPLPDVAPQLLTGDAPDHLWEHLATLVREDGYALDRGPCPPGVNGYTDPLNKNVRVSQAVEPAQAAKTLAHELGHIRAEHARRFPDYATDLVCRGQAEVEAESIAYIVTTNAGMTSDVYSVPYVASWARGDTVVLRQSVTTILATARTMITGPRAAELSRSGTGPTLLVSRAAASARRAGAPQSRG